MKMFGFTFCLCDKSPAKTTLEKTGFVDFQLLYHPLQEQVQNLKKIAPRNVDDWLATPGLLSFFSHSVQTYQPRDEWHCPQ